MKHEKGKVVGSFTFPAFIQTQTPSCALPPPQPYMGKAVTNRGRPGKGTRLGEQRRGHPFSIEWSDPDRCPKVTFGKTGTYLLPWMGFLTFQRILESSNPLRECSHLIRAHNLGI